MTEEGTSTLLCNVDRLLYQNNPLKFFSAKDSYTRKITPIDSFLFEMTHKTIYITIFTNSPVQKRSNIVYNQIYYTIAHIALTNKVL